MKIVVLVSGGMDSTILVQFTKKYYPNAEIVLLHYDYGHPFEHKERQCLPEGTIIRRFDWLDSSKEYEIPEHLPEHLPGRDFAMIAQAMIQENPDKIFLALLHGEMTLYLDQNFEFYHRLNHLLSMVSPTGKRVEVETPLEACGFDKIKAAKWALDNGLTLEDLANTSSCMHHEENKCGRCAVCIRRWAIFTLLDGSHLEEMNVFADEESVRKLYDVIECENENIFIEALKKHFKTESISSIRNQLSLLLNSEFIKANQ